MAYPSVLLGVEYDGRDQERVLRDLERQALLTEAGWKIVRFRARTVLHCPREVAAEVDAELTRRGSRR